MNTENQHWLRDMFERAMSGTSYLEALLHKNLSEDEYPLVLQDLTEIDFSDNQLTSLPNEISTFSKLTKLYLHNNQLTKLPEELIKLTNLTTISIYNNPNLTLTDNQNKWLEELETNGCVVYKERAEIKVETLESKDIPSLEDWKDNEIRKFIQEKKK